MSGRLLGHLCVGGVARGRGECFAGRHGSVVRAGWRSKREHLPNQQHHHPPHAEYAYARTTPPRHPSPQSSIFTSVMYNSITFLCVLCWCHHRATARVTWPLYSLFHRLRTGAGFGWARAPIIRPAVIRLSSSSSSSSSGNNDGKASEAGQEPVAGAAAGGADATQEEIDRIRGARMTAGQIKVELDALGVSYVGLLEKSEYVQALAEARVSGGGGGGRDDSPPVEQTEAANPNGTADTSSEASSAGVPKSREPSATEAGDAMPAADDAVAEAKARLEEDGKAAAAKSAKEKQQAEENAAAAAAAAKAKAEKAQQEVEAAVADAAARAKAKAEAEAKVKQEEQEQAAAAAAKAEQAAQAKKKEEQAAAAAAATAAAAEHEAQSKQDEEEAPAAAVDPVASEAKAAATGAGEEDATPASGLDDGDGDAAPSADPAASSGGGGGSGGVDEEITKIRDARMTAGQIKAELDTLGVSHVGLLEKAEFVTALAEARVAGVGKGAAAEEGNSDAARSDEKEEEAEEASTEQGENNAARGSDVPAASAEVDSTVDAVEQPAIEEPVSSPPSPSPPPPPPAAAAPIKEEKEERVKEDGKKESGEDEVSCFLDFLVFLFLFLPFHRAVESVFELLMPGLFSRRTNCVGGGPHSLCGCGKLVCVDRLIRKKSKPVTAERHGALNLAQNAQIGVPSGRIKRAERRDTEMNTTKRKGDGNRTDSVQIPGTTNHRSANFSSGAIITQPPPDATSYHPTIVNSNGGPTLQTHCRRRILTQRLK